MRRPGGLRQATTIAVLVLAGLVLARPAGATQIQCPRDGIGEVSLSDDGTVLAWSTKRAIYVARADHPADVGSRAVDVCPGVASLRLSGDGRMVLWSEGLRADEDGSLRYDLWAARLQGLSFRQPRMLAVDATFFLDAGRSGAELAFGLDAPSTDGCSPGSRAVGYASLRNGRYGIESIDRPATCEFAEFVGLDGSGGVLFQENRRARQGLIRHATRQGSKWSAPPILGGELSLRAVSRSGDLLLEGYDAHNRITVFISRRSGGAWEPPEALSQVTPSSLVGGAVISPDGETVAWPVVPPADEWERGTSIVMMRRTRLGWQGPIHVFSTKSYPSTMALSNRSLVVALIGRDAPGGLSSDDAKLLLLPEPGRSSRTIEIPRPLRGAIGSPQRAR
jgi:hypothetical protein